MTLSSRHRIRNSSPGGLRPSTLPLGHGGSPQYWLSHVDGKKQFCFFRTAETGNRTPNSGVKGSGANHYPRAPDLGITKVGNVDSGAILLHLALYRSRGQWRCKLVFTQQIRHFDPMLVQCWASVAELIAGPASQNWEELTSSDVTGIRRNCFFVNRSDRILFKFTDTAYFSVAFAKPKGSIWPVE